MSSEMKTNNASHTPHDPLHYPHASGCPPNGEVGTMTDIVTSKTQGPVGFIQRPVTATKDRLNDTSCSHPSPQAFPQLVVLDGEEHGTVRLIAHGEHPNLTQGGIDPGMESLAATDVSAYHIRDNVPLGQACQPPDVTVT